MKFTLVLLISLMLTSISFATPGGPALEAGCHHPVGYPAHCHK